MVETQLCKLRDTSDTLVGCRALISSPASVAGTVTGDARRVVPAARAYGDFVCDICTSICAKTKQQSALKRLPNLEKACVIPWGVLEKKRVDHTYTFEVRSSSGPASLHPGQPIKKREIY